MRYKGMGSWGLEKVRDHEARSFGGSSEGSSC